jgi:two-component system, NarL family, sensor histidine kinase LiaS
MNGSAAAFKNRPQRTKQSWQKWPRWRGLQVRMTLSYVWMTMLLVLLIVILAVLLLILVLNTLTEQAALALGQKTSVQYAYAASLQSDGLQLNPRSTFQPGQIYTLLPPGTSAPGQHARRTFFLDTLVIPYVPDANPHPSPEEFALLIAPDGRIMASSYPARYPANTAFSAPFPQQVASVAQAYQGTSLYAKRLPETLYFAAPIWGKGSKPIGVFYLQGQETSIGGQEILLFLRDDPFIVVGTILLVLLITTPLGSAFGLLTTRGLVRRIRYLVSVTTDFVGSNYAKRVPVSRQDEIGQLENHFNQMADQLVESFNRQQELAGQNARLAERARISRELHDAISQDLFSLRMLAYGFHDALPADSEFQTQVAALEGTTSRMISEMRALLLELRPTHLEHGGLAEALEDLAASYSERLGITVTTKITPIELPAEAEHALLRITQEALSNAVRHARATQITLSLIPTEQDVSLTLRDNGQGFAFDANQKGHGFGLNSMRERVHELHGTFTVQTAPGKGTEISVHLPLKGDFS